MSTEFVVGHHVQYITQFNPVEPVRPFTRAYAFVKNNQKMTRYDFKEVFDQLTKYLDEMVINYGILLTPGGSYVFTEDHVAFDGLLVKLSTGINFEEQVSLPLGALDTVNHGLKRNTEHNDQNP